MNENSGPAVLVTGATSGIGLELAGLLARERFRVFGGVFPGEDTAPLALTGATLVSLDVTDPTSLTAAREEVAKHLGDIPLWGRVNNAGVVGIGPVELLDLEEARQVFEVNVLGVLAATQTFLPSIRAAKGRVVNVSSVSALLSVPFLGPYNASKAAVECLSDALRRELLPFGVDVVVVQLGTTRTRLWNQARDADPTPFLGSDYLDAMRTVQRKAVKRGNKGQPPADVARAILEGPAQAVRPPPLQPAPADPRSLRRSPVRKARLGPLTGVARRGGAYGEYQMGEVQARSWMTGRWSSEQQALSPSGTASGSPQSTPAAMHTYWLQRQLGFSRTRP
jgi:NAD(P)-dependent dehydrogenase (short-subunit alcohol dehydrogenase family)